VDILVIALHYSESGGSAEVRFGKRSRRWRVSFTAFLGSCRFTAAKTFAEIF